MKRVFIFINLVLIYLIIDVGVAGVFDFFASSFEATELATFSGTTIQTIEKKNSHDKSYYQIISSEVLPQFFLHFPYQFHHF